MHQPTALVPALVVPLDLERNLYDREPIVWIHQTRLLLDGVEHLVQRFQHLLTGILEKTDLSQVGRMQVERDIDIVNTSLEFLVPSRVEREHGNGTVYIEHGSAASTCDFARNFPPLRDHFHAFSYIHSRPCRRIAGGSFGTIRHAGNRIPSTPRWQKNRVWKNPRGHVTLDERFPTLRHSCIGPQQVETVWIDVSLVGNRQRQRLARPHRHGHVQQPQTP